MKIYTFEEAKPFLKEGMEVELVRGRRGHGECESEKRPLKIDNDYYINFPDGAHTFHPGETLIIHKDEHGNPWGEPTTTLKYKVGDVVEFKALGTTLVGKITSLDIGAYPYRIDIGEIGHFKNDDEIIRKVEPEPPTTQIHVNSVSAGVALYGTPEYQREIYQYLQVGDEVEVVSVEDTTYYGYLVGKVWGVLAKPWDNQGVYLRTKKYNNYVSDVSDTIRLVSTHGNRAIPELGFYPNEVTTESLYKIFNDMVNNGIMDEMNKTYSNFSYETQAYKPINAPKEQKNNIMTNLKNFYKKLTIKEPERTLIKHGLETEDGELTDAAAEYIHDKMVREAWAAERGQIAKDLKEQDDKEVK